MKQQDHTSSPARSTNLSAIGEAAPDVGCQRGQLLGRQEEVGIIVRYFHI
jgi:hypothetical protein